jgi:Membrane transport protein
MNLSGLVAALLPVFFVLALGYAAGKRNAFDPDQAAGLSKLAVSFALPASLFVGMTEIPSFNPRTMPMKPMNADQCVAEALRALQENRSMIIPGKMNRLMNAVIPASFKRNITAKTFTKVLANSRSTVCRSC